MVLMLTVGRWADVLHILMCFLGEAGCLIPTKDLLDATSSQVRESLLTSKVTQKRHMKDKMAGTQNRSE